MACTDISAKRLSATCPSRNAPGERVSTRHVTHPVIILASVAEVEELRESLDSEHGAESEVEKSLRNKLQKTEQYLNQLRSVPARS